MPPKRCARKPAIGRKTKQLRVTTAGAVVLGTSPPCPGCPYGGTRERKGMRPSGRPKFRARCSRCQRETRSTNQTTILQSGCPKKLRGKNDHLSRSTGGVSKIEPSASVAKIAELLCEAAGAAGELPPPVDFEL
jgi:hypothetical protein